ncbi:N-acetyltransferase family protein [Streptomyces sp. NPDC002067]
MVEISFLIASDRACWEALARSKDTYFDVERSDDDFERTWRRLLADEQIRGIAARLDGKIVGIAHYLFHASVWYSGKCYLADLFVDAEVRRRGIARAVIEWVARDAKEHGFPALYWNTLEDAPARALYDRVGKFHKGFIHYSYRRDANQSSTQRDLDQTEDSQWDDLAPGLKSVVATTSPWVQIPQPQQLSTAKWPLTRKSWSRALALLRHRDRPAFPVIPRWIGHGRGTVTS